MTDTITIKNFHCSKHGFVKPKLNPECPDCGMTNFVVCGRLQESGDKTFIGGCGEPVNVMEVYACIDCSAPFHRKCLLKHIHEDMPVQSISKMSLEEGLKKLDELASGNCLIKREE